MPETYPKTANYLPHSNRNTLTNATQHKPKPAKQGETRTAAQITRYYPGGQVPQNSSCTSRKTSLEYQGTEEVKSANLNMRMLLF